MSKTKRVAILAYDGLASFEFGCALELFSLPRPEMDAWYQTSVVSLTGEPVSAMGGISVAASDSIELLDQVDMLVIPGWNQSAEGPVNRLIEKIRALHERGGRVVAFCSGAFLLAETGLLDGAIATTHWRYQHKFQQRFPAVSFAENVLYTGEDQLFCSAGSAAALDLGLHIIRLDFGADVANVVARRLVISPHREGGQAQFVERPLQPAEGVLAETLDWVLPRLDKKVTVGQMAEFANMTRRSFDRKFRQTTGCSPKEWLVTQRLQLAKDHLESGTDSIDRVAEKSGFISPMNLRHHFQQQFGISPSQYRRQFRHD